MNETIIAKHLETYKIKNSLLTKFLFSILILLSLSIIFSFFYLSRLKIISLILILFTVFVSKKDLKNGIYLFILTLPFMFVPWVFGKNLAISEVVLFTVLLIFSINNFNRDIEIKKTRFNIPILLYLLISVLVFIKHIDLSLIFSFNILKISSSYFIFRTLLIDLEIALVFLLITNLLKKEDLHRATLILIASAFIASLYGILQFFLLNFTRASSFFEYPSFFAMFLIMVFPVLIYHSTYKGAWVYSFIFISFIFAIFLTFSIDGWLSFILSLLFLSIFSKTTRKKAIFFLLLFIILISGISVYSNTRSLIVNDGSKITAEFSERVDLTGILIEDRLNIWQEFINKIKEHPIIGAGPKVIIVNNWPEEHAHNIFLELLLEKGIFGLLAFVWILFLLFRPIKKYDLYSLALTTGILAFILQSTSDYILKINLLFALYLALNRGKWN